eukprot:COSAG06_NODE_3740_length_4957_cov_8.283821_1_plen_147_part_10
MAEIEARTLVLAFELRAAAGADYLGKVTAQHGINPRLEESLVLGTRATAAANAKSFRELEKSIFIDHHKWAAALTQARRASWSHATLHIVPPMVAKQRNAIKKYLDTESVSIMLPELRGVVNHLPVENIRRQLGNEMRAWSDQQICT